MQMHPDRGFSTLAAEYSFGPTDNVFTFSSKGNIMYAN